MTLSLPPSGFEPESPAPGGRYAHHCTTVTVTSGYFDFVRIFVRVIEYHYLGCVVCERLVEFYQKDLLILCRLKSVVLE